MSHKAISTPTSAFGASTFPSSARGRGRELAGAELGAQSADVPADEHRRELHEGRRVARRRRLAEPHRAVVRRHADDRPAHARVDAGRHQVRRDERDVHGPGFDAGDPGHAPHRVAPGRRDVGGSACDGDRPRPRWARPSTSFRRRSAQQSRRARPSSSTVRRSIGPGTGRRPCSGATRSPRPGSTRGGRRATAASTTTTAPVGASSCSRVACRPSRSWSEFHVG